MIFPNSYNNMRDQIASERNFSLVFSPCCDLTQEHVAAWSTWHCFLKSFLCSFCFTKNIRDANPIQFHFNVCFRIKLHFNKIHCSTYFDIAQRKSMKNHTCNICTSFWVARKLQKLFISDFIRNLTLISFGKRSQRHSSIFANGKESQLNKQEFESFTEVYTL